VYPIPNRRESESEGECCKPSGANTCHTSSLLEGVSGFRVLNESRDSVAVPHFLSKAFAKFDEQGIIELVGINADLIFRSLTTSQCRHPDSSDSGQVLRAAGKAGALRGTKEDGVARRSEPPHEFFTLSDL